MKLELAKAGNHNGITITKEDLIDMTETFSGDVPVTIGHELDDSMPAYGWVKLLSLSEDESTLIGEIELGEELETSISDGKYKNWSIGAGKDSEEKMYLHHVAFLGAVPPMIKDLQIIEMGDQTDIITFAVPQGTCSFLLSDIDLAEYTSLRIEKKNQAIKRLSDVTSGKLPFGKREELIQFADKLMSDKQGPETVEFLSQIFESVKTPVREGLSEKFSAKRAEMQTSFFRKI
ncbi:MAG: hypothetical protein C0603_05675 [Denitrovibrio sp.]|nr:MAG: hypothetical protein C0603_05675 [Denitrovibrio sp.]